MTDAAATPAPRRGRKPKEDPAKIAQEDASLMAELSKKYAITETGEVLGEFLGGSADGNDDDGFAINRAPRDAETRETELRDGPEWMPRQYLPVPNPEPGYKFRYVRLTTKGANDDINVMGRMQEGWRVVKPEEQPEIVARLPNQGKGQDRIVIGDNILCKCSEAILKVRNEHYRRMSKNQIKGVESQLLSHQRAVMPIMKPSIVTQVSRGMAPKG